MRQVGLKFSSRFSVLLLRKLEAVLDDFLQFDYRAGSVTVEIIQDRLVSNNQAIIFLVAEVVVQYCMVSIPLLFTIVFS